MHAYFILFALLALPAYRMAPADAETALLAQRWTPAAAAWFAATVPVTVDYAIAAERHAGDYRGPPERAAVRVFMAPAPYILEHEAHHAWDDAHGLTDGVRRRADLAALGHPVARAVLADPAVDDAHLMHALIERLDRDTGALPDWFRERYFGYVTKLTKHRIVLPVVGSRA